MAETYIGLTQITMRIDKLIRARIDEALQSFETSLSAEVCILELDTEISRLLLRVGKGVNDEES